MKKFFMALAVCGTLFMMSCGSSKSDKATDILEKATTEIQNAKTHDDAMKIFRATAEEIQGLKLSESDQKKAEKAYEAFEKAAVEKGVLVIQE